MNKSTRYAAAALTAVSAATLVACGGGGDNDNEQAMGTLRVAVTDAPCHAQYDAVFVTVEKVRVHQSATAAETDGGWSEVVLAAPLRVDLLTLTNGALATLGQTQLPAGDYTQARLVLAANGGSAPFANAVTPAGGSEVALDTPSGQQSGLKVNVNVSVPEGQVADLVIDFDVCKSVVKRGNSGQYNLKPKVTVTPVLSEAGYRVVGYVTPAMAAAGTAVSVQSAGVPLKATVPDPDGRFVLYPVPVGNYDLVVSSTGRVTAVITGVPVSAASHTVLNDLATPIAAPALQLGTREVPGTVTPTSARLLALQTINGSIPIQVASAPVDALDGSYLFTLPIDSPVVAAWTAVPLTWNFVADASATGLYTVEARTDLASQQRGIDVRTPVSPLVFTFP